MADLELINIFMMNFEPSEFSIQLHKLLKLYKITTDIIDNLDDYINNISNKMMAESLAGYSGRVSLMAQTKCAALGVQNMYFLYYEQIKNNIKLIVNGDSDVNRRTLDSYPIISNSQETGCLNKVLCLEFNSETRSS